MRAANQFADAATGVVYIHASPAAVCPHVEWALSSTLNARANLKWTPQPAMPGQLRAVTNWVGPVGTGAQLANALRSWSVLRFEVTEDPSHGVDGHRWSHTPHLGLWSGRFNWGFRKECKCGKPETGGNQPTAENASGDQQVRTGANPTRATCQCHRGNDHKHRPKTSG